MSLSEDLVTPADPPDMGAGRADLNVAASASLTFDETAENLARRSRQCRASQPAVGERLVDARPFQIDHDAGDERRCCWWKPTISLSNAGTITVQPRVQARTW